MDRSYDAEKYKKQKHDSYFESEVLEEQEQHKQPPKPVSNKQNLKMKTEIVKTLPKKINHKAETEKISEEKFGLNNLLKERNK